jgi:hypothetical protein
MTRSPFIADRQPAKRAGGFVFAENFKQWG